MRCRVCRRSSTGVAGIGADLVVDARVPARRRIAWLAAIGASPVPEELHESGIVYFSRFYRVQPDADVPPVAGAAAADLGYLKFAVFVGDNEHVLDHVRGRIRTTTSCGRRSRHEEPFEAAALALVPTAPWRADRVSPSRSPACT